MRKCLNKVFKLHMRHISYTYISAAGEQAMAPTNL